MKEHGQFEDKPAGKSASAPPDKLDCTAVELLWVEAVEGTLASSSAAHVLNHTVECPSCREKISQARKGREWLLMLKMEPLVPASDLVARIIARTTGVSESSHARPSSPNIHGETETGSADRYSFPGYGFPNSETPIPSETVGGRGGFGHDWVPSTTSSPVWQRPSVVFLRKTVFEPRIALVAAMAFFSISLTLNLLGVRLTNFRVADLQPQSMRRAITRQYAEANAHVVHYYENLRIVYEVESRVHQLQQAADSAPVQEKTSYPVKQRSGRDGNGGRSDQKDQSDRDGVHRERMDVVPVKHQNAQRNRFTPVEPAPVFSGPVIDASMIGRPWTGLNTVESGHPQLISTVLSESICTRAALNSSQLLLLHCSSLQERNLA